MSEILRAVVVNRAVIVHDDWFLLLQRAANDSHNPLLWEFPGGKLDAGEDISTGLQREVLEETGLSVEVASPLTYVENEPLMKRRGVYIALFHIARRLDGELRLSDEHETASWETVDSALTRRLTPASQRAIVSFAQAGLI